MNNDRSIPIIKIRIKQLGNEAIADLLLRNGANVNHKESDGSTALHRAAIKGEH